MKAADSIEVSIEAPLSRAEAFELFTRRIDAWWKRGPKHRFRSPWNTGVLVLEPHVGGRLIEQYPNGEAFEIGRVQLWEPPARFAMSWRLPNFSGDEATHVEVRFHALDTGCRVSVIHSGLTTLRPDHPARHGQSDPAFLRNQAHLWIELLNALRAEAQRTPSQEEPHHEQRPDHHPLHSRARRRQRDRVLPQGVQG
jgi:hypothetical protein